MTAPAAAWRIGGRASRKSTFALPPKAQSNLLKHERAKFGLGGTQPLSRPKHDFCHKLRQHFRLVSRGSAHATGGNQMSALGH